MMTGTTVTLTTGNTTTTEIEKNQRHDGGDFEINIEK